jgi:hypothetical protein
MRSSKLSFRFLILSPPSATVARARLFSYMVRMRSSAVFPIVNLYILTSRVWQKRWARSKAWSLSTGFYHKSTRITLLHAVNVRPVGSSGEQLGVGGAISIGPGRPAFDEVQNDANPFRLTSRFSFDLFPSS